MKILHIADLHFGKSLAGQSLVEDQRDWVDKFVALVDAEKPDAVLVAGDVYDRGAPSEDAVDLLDRFVTRVLAVDARVHILMTAGNHDSGTKLAFGSELLKKQRLHIVGRLSAEIERVVLTDSEGPVTFWLLPFTFPAAIQQVLGEETPRDYTAALKALLDRQSIDATQRNVFVAHQSVTWEGKESELGGSETIIGGVGNVDGAIFDTFDYVALGHIHKAQPVGRETMRYAGSPLCYHFDEAKYARKGAVCVTLAAKGNAQVEVKEIAPLHPVREIRGTYEAILRDEQANSASGEYVKVVLTDRYLDPSISEALRALFIPKNSVALELKSEYSALTSSVADGNAVGTPERTLDQKFTDFWQSRHGGVAPDEGKLRLIRKVAEQLATNGASVDADAEALVKFALEDR